MLTLIPKPYKEKKMQSYKRKKSELTLSNFNAKVLNSDLEAITSYHCGTKKEVEEKLSLHSSFSQSIERKFV